MKVYGRYCLVDTDQVALYVEGRYGDTYDVLYKTYGDSGYGTIFRGSLEQSREIMNLIVKAEQNAEKVFILPDE